jgi:hypothetical protein
MNALVGSHGTSVPVPTSVGIARTRTYLTRFVQIAAMSLLEKTSSKQGKPPNPGVAMEFTMTHPAVCGPFKVSTFEKGGLTYYSAETESGILAEHVTLAKTEDELREQVTRNLTRRLS